MDKILGLDLGTNSLGWAVVEDRPDGYTLREHGVDIFQEGVKIEKGIESSKAAERTEHRSARRRLMRRKLRKIETLKVLSDAGLCPRLAPEQLKAWKQQGIYPLDEPFIRWQRTAGDKNPYHDRHEALTRKLDLNTPQDRHMLGRALYHIAQRRGFLSNRLEKTKESEGKVKEGIQQLDRDMQEAGCRFLGEYFYHCYQNDTKIRTRYTSRKAHYKAEFDEICRVQQLDDELKKALEKAIFFQRPLKSQKGLVGKCTFEKSKSRCPVSHPRFEQFRMLSFINNIKIQTPQDETLRPLNAREKEQIIPLFLRKSKKQFDFEDIAKKLAGKDKYAYDKDNTGKPYRFNFKMKTSVSGSPVTAQIQDIFGEQWEQALTERYTAKEGKTTNQIVNDAWHVLFSFDDDDKLKAFAVDKLRCTEEEAEAFCEIHLPQDYAALSLHAIDKILPFLREGLLYSHAVFLANMGKVLPAEVWNSPERKQRVVREVTRIIEGFTREDAKLNDTIENRIGDFIEDSFNVPISVVREKLYHPSMIETYPAVRPDKQGRIRLASPRTSAVRNPMAMRSLFRLRKLINTLLDEGKIDRNTKIRIEFARGLNDANRRKAIETWQREREAKRKKYRLDIQDLYLQECGREIEPTETDVLKFELWEEQNRECLYTGRAISICQFIGADPEFDIEHTIPRSVGGDDSLMNKTLCEKAFNREQKKNKLPSQLACHGEIEVRIAGWKKKCDDLHAQIERTRGSFSTKEIKDAMIQKRHRLKLELDYWSGKYRRFTMTDVPEGFSNRQGIDIGIISKYARLYLKSVFPKTYVVKGLATAEFRRMWGLQEQYEKKERNNHVHHCIDAITIACIGPNEYAQTAAYFHDQEQYRWYRNREKPQFPKPWPTFTEDVLAIEQELLVSHHTPDNMSRQTKKKWRVRGQVQYGENKEPLYVNGDSARGSLHQDTFYGAILREGEDGEMVVKHVVRKSLGQLNPGDEKKIVDDVVREKIQQAIAEKGFKQAMLGPIWMNEEKGIEIKKVRCFAGHVNSPILLKEHRDQSRHDHKRHLRVVNDGNYLMAIYEGADAKGKTKRDFEIVNNLTAAEYFKASSDKEAFATIVPQSNDNGYPLKWTFKSGTMVLFYENTPEEIYEADHAELRKRLYKVIGMSKQTISGKWNYGIFTFKHHQEARPGVDLKEKKGEYKSGEEYRPIICMNHNQIKALVEGYDFELTVTGEVKFKKR
ncbi:CRISPR-associated protein Csn1 [Alistipes sp. OttesenSCG-928-L06]|nr:CRISPR-associated protein Csn1 [Alistipes sp. OttesenSCG-928-L06]